MVLCDWINFQVLKPHEPSTVGTVVRTMAYYAGSVALEHLIPVVRRIRGWEHPLQQIGPVDTPEQRDDLRCRMLIASELLDPTQRDLLPLMKLHADLIARERKQKSSPSLPLASLDELVASALDALWTKCDRVNLSELAATSLRKAA
jgi:hypothetical protein